MGSSSCGEVRADEQDGVVGVSGRHHPRGGGAEPAGSIDLLTSGILVAGPVAASPEAERRAGGPTVDVASEDDCAGGRVTCKAGPELGALRAVRGRLIGLGGGEVGGAY